MTKIAIILGSTRPGRNGKQVADWVLAQAAQRGQPLGVALGQQVDGAVLRAQAQRRGNAVVRLGVGFAQALAFAQLQAQALGQVARAHARRIHRL